MTAFDTIRLWKDFRVSTLKSEPDETLDAVCCCWNKDGPSSAYHSNRSWANGVTLGQETADESMGAERQITPPLSQLWPTTPRSAHEKSCPQFVVPQNNVSFYRSLRARPKGPEKIAPRPRVSDAVRYLFLTLVLTVVPQAVG